MSSLIERTTRFMAMPLDLRSRGLLVLAAVLLVAALVFPLWTLTMFAPQYPDGLRLNIYSYKLDGGNRGQDVKEINVLNHYIGMRDLVTDDFTEFKWMPFVVGALGLLFLRAAVHGQMSHLLDVIVLYLYFAGFAVGSFAFKLYSYGHSLAPTAAVKVPPFMPPMFGFKQLANFEVYSYPAVASYALGFVIPALLLAMFLAWRSARLSRPARAV
jgi:copper chaperone NosL